MEEILMKVEGCSYYFILYSSNINKILYEKIRRLKLRVQGTIISQSN
jgi:hypothetical protein